MAEGGLRGPWASVLFTMGATDRRSDPGSAPDWDNLTGALQQVVQTAVPLPRDDGAGLMLADQYGTLHIVTGTDQGEQTFERAERDLGEGTLVDAFAIAAPRWCGPATCGPTRGGRGWARQPGPTRSAGPVGPAIQEGRPIGTCNALTTSPKTWADNDIGAIRTYADMLAQLVGSVAGPATRASWPPSCSSPWSPRC